VKQSIDSFADIFLSRKNNHNTISIVSFGGTKKWMLREEKDNNGT